MYVTDSPAYEETNPTVENDVDDYPDDEEPGSASMSLSWSVPVSTGFEPLLLLLSALIPLYLSLQLK